MHTIRLRKPWSKSGAGVGGRCRVDVPDLDSPDLDRPERAGGEHAKPASGSEPGLASLECGEPAEVVYQRKFNRPTGLTDSSRVWLKISGWSGSLAEVQINGQRLTAGARPWRADVTAAIGLHNQLEIRLAANESGLPRLTGEVTLAIEQELA